MPLPSPWKIGRVSLLRGTTAREALQAIQEDGDIQSVVVDDTLYTLKNGEKGSRNLQMTALKLVQEINRFRPELDIYILIAQEKEDEVVDALFSETVDVILSGRAGLSGDVPHSQCAASGKSPHAFL